MKKQKEDKNNFFSGTIDEKDEILTEKVLQKSINDSIMNIDIFITTKENIATLS